MNAAAEAGPRGADVRSDAWIRVEQARSGGVEISLTSKVASLYGSAIRRQLETGCRELGLENVRVEVEDGGAVPFVLAARLEAAVRRLHPEMDHSLLPALRPGNDEPSEKERFRRSRLYVPGSQPKFMLNAALHRPDGVILDFEDSVAPAEKDAARPLVRNALRTLDWRGAERMVRINQLPAGLEDLPFVVGHGAQLILIPKVESPQQVVAVAEEAARLAGVARPPWLMPILESARGVLAAADIAGAHPTVCALTIGLEDFTADIGAARTEKGTESFWARSVVVAAARAAGVQPIASVYSDVANREGLLQAVREAKELGFEGMGCIHPRQIAPVHEAFAPTAVELKRAQRIVRAFAEVSAKGLGVVSLGTKMIDRPVVKRAQKVVDLAVRTGMLSADWLDAAGEEVEADA
jgi:citrate lyase subunit beta/citryl-CoA lyase